MAEIIQESIQVKKLLLDEKRMHSIQKIGDTIIQTLHNHGTIFMAGNGGSAADAQHFAAELAGKFETERPGLRAISLATNVSNITAIANDYNYDVIFSRQLEGLGNKNDIFFGISTSGNSKNIIEAMKMAKNKKMITVGLLGCDGGKIKDVCDIFIIVPSNITARIQECHIMIIHILSKMVDKEFTGKIL